MEENPCIAVVSCSEVQPESIIELITKHTGIKEVTEPNTSAGLSYIWDIDTKYYTAKVNIYPLKSHTNYAKFNDKSVEAIIVHFDSNKISGLEDLKVWQSFINDHQPDIKLLLSNTCDANTKITKAKATEWCLENGFELIELNPILTTDDSTTEDEIIKETVGAERIIEALQTHIWSNLVMKSKDSSGNVQDGTKSSNIDEMLDNLMIDDDQLEFGDLFQRLHMMKESVQSMSTRERRHCAEQVVTAFWRAIGGDEEEIGNL